MRRFSVPEIVLPADVGGAAFTHRKSVQSVIDLSIPQHVCIDETEVRGAQEALFGPNVQERHIETVVQSRHSRLLDQGLLATVAMSQLLDEYFLSGFVILMPQLAKEFSIPISSITWPASAYSLVVSAFLLFFGRLSDVYGSFVVYTGGLFWIMIWGLVGGFVTDETMLNVSRAMQGLAAAAYLPSSLSILNMITNTSLLDSDLIFFIYGAMAPLGTFLGILVAALTLQFANWRWFFWIGSIMAGLTCLLVVLLGIPKKQYILRTQKSDLSVDWLGNGVLISGLTLVVFSITHVSHTEQGWSTWYIPFTLALGICFLAGFGYVEMRFSKHPVIPRELWKVPCLPAFSIGLLFNYGTTNVILLYGTLYFVNILEVKPILLAAWFAPMAAGGCILAVSGGLLLRFLSRTMLLILSGLTTILASLLLAVSPIEMGYWPWVFPAMICATLSIDLVFNLANLFFLKSCPIEYQGSAGGLANMLVQLSGAIILGFAEMLLTYTQSGGLAQAYKNVFWLSLACGCVSSIIFIVFVRIRDHNTV